jgi:hypothetical protein
MQSKDVDRPFFAQKIGDFIFYSSFEYWKVFNLAWKMNLSDWWAFCILFYQKDPRSSREPLFTLKNKYVQGILAYANFITAIFQIIT